MNQSRLGYFHAISAYVLWGVFPLYWKLLPTVTTLEVICHRIAWSLVTLTLCVLALRQTSSILELFKAPGKVLFAGLAASLISVNWFVFIWAVQNNFVVDASLGYFINPLLTVMLAVLLFGETLTGLQWASIGTALTGVAIMTVEKGQIPWVAVLLATSFACYAAVKKKTQLSAVSGLWVETAILAPLALALMLCFHFWNQWEVLSSGDEILHSIGMSSPSKESYTIRIWMLLALGGPVTTLPLLLFASASKNVPLVAMGMLQYVGPTIQFMLGVLLYREPLTGYRLLGFVFVWFALILFTWGSILKERSKQLAQNES